MLLFQSLLVYGVMVYVMFYFANKASQKPYPKKLGDFISDPNYIIPILFFALIASVRWNVGVDCNSYMEEYYSMKRGFGLMTRDTFEPGYMLLSKVSIAFNWSHIPLFFVIAALQLFFVYYALRDKPQVIAFFSIMLVLSGDYWSYMNGMRQVLACCMFLVALKCLCDKQPIRMLIVIMLACLFHKSALLLFPICLIALFSRNLFKNVYLQVGIICLCYFLMSSLSLPSFDKYIRAILGFLNYDNTSDVILTDVTIAKNFGFRSMLTLLANMAVVIYSNKMKLFYKDKFLDSLYAIFYIGICLSLLFYGNHGFERLAMFFTSYNAVLLAFCAYFLFKSQEKHYRFDRIVLLGMCLFLLMRTGYDFYESFVNLPTTEYILYKFSLGRTIIGM